MRLLAAHLPGFSRQVALRAAGHPPATFVEGRELGDAAESPLRSPDAMTREAAWIAVAEVLSGFGPRVEIAAAWETGFVDVTGARDEGPLPARLRAALARAGFEARAAIAGNRFTARTVAAFGSLRPSGSPGASPGPPAPAGTVVPPGGEREALATRPVAALPLDARAAQVLARLGIATLGDLARLPADTLARRFGAPAAGWSARARGDDATPLEPFPLPQALFERIEPPAPLDRLEPILFTLKTLVQRVGARLAGRGAAAAKLAVHLVLEEGWGDAGAIRRPAVSSQAVEIRLPRPTVSARTILEVARETLARVSLPGPVREIALEAVETVPARRTQRSLDGRAMPFPERLETTLGRLASAFGEEGVFSAALADEYRPERAFVRAPPLPERDPPDRTGHRSSDRSGPWPSALPLRLLPVPEAVAVAREGEAAVLVARGARRRIVEASGPERLSGEWWERPFDRDYWRVRTGGPEGAARWWIFRDRDDGRWYLHGLFD